jgi:hypothetical protein
VLVSVLSISYLMSPLSFYFSLCKSVRLISLLGSLVLCLGEQRDRSHDVSESRKSVSGTAGYVFSRVSYNFVPY